MFRPVTVLLCVNYQQEPAIRVTPVILQAAVICVLRFICKKQLTLCTKLSRSLLVKLNSSQKSVTVNSVYKVPASKLGSNFPKLNLICQ